MAGKKNLTDKLKEVSTGSQIDALLGLEIEKVVEQEVTIEKMEEKKEDIPPLLLEEHEVVQVKNPTPSTVPSSLTPAQMCLIPQGYELRPERKTERLQLRLPPSVLALVKQSAQKESVSVNQWILDAIQKDL